jgi:hypothetical protein
MVLRLLLALLGSGMASAFLFAVVYVAPIQYLTLLIVSAPIVLALSLLLGAPIFFVLRRLKVRLSVMVCLIFGAAIGAVPGLLIWATSMSPSTLWSATEELRAAAINPIVFSAFGGFGGLFFSGLAKLLRLQ